MWPHDRTSSGPLMKTSKTKHIAKLCGVLVDVAPTIYDRLSPNGHHALTFGEPELPRDATQERPGTFEKLEVMRKRAALGQAIFHPGDLVLTGPRGVEKPETLKLTFRKSVEIEAWNNF